jgi:hypothetical protein
MKKIQLIIISLFLISLKGFSQNDTAQIKKVFVPSGKLWGQIFGDYTYKLHANTFNMGNTQYATYPKDFNSFDYRRIFLGYDYDISEKFSSAFLLASDGQIASDGSRAIYVKAVYLRWKNIFKNIDLVLGQQPTSTFTVASDTWGYRSLEKTIMDFRKIGVSYDFGVSLQGKFNKNGDYGYSLMVGNGSGTKPENDKFKKKYVDIWGKFLDKKLILDIGCDNEIAQTSPYKKSKTTIKGFVSYQMENVTIGLEAFSQLQKNYTMCTEPVPSVLKDTTNAVASGITMFVKGFINSKLGWVVRYDHYNPDTKFNANDVYSTAYPSFYTESFVLAGLDYIVAKNVHVMPNIWYDKYDNRAVAFNKLDKSSYDLAARITVFYAFNK